MSVDNRGNVIDIYVGDEPTGRIDREAEPISGIEFEFGFGLVGGEHEIKVAIEEGYEQDVAAAIMCEFLRGEDEANDHAKDFIRAICV